MPWIYYSMNRDKKSPSLTLEQFMFRYLPWTKQRRREQTPEDMQTMLIALNAALGGEMVVARDGCD